MLRHRTRFTAQSGVERRLSAASLFVGKIHIKVEAVENVHDGFTRLRVERIDETGDEQLNVSHESIVILPPVIARSDSDNTLRALPVTFLSGTGAVQVSHPRICYELASVDRNDRVGYGMIICYDDLQNNLAQTF